MKSYHNFPNNSNHEKPCKKKWFHGTNKVNQDQILKKGLVPHIGSTTEDWASLYNQDIPDEITQAEDQKEALYKYEKQLEKEYNNLSFQDRDPEILYKNEKKINMLKSILGTYFTDCKDEAIEYAGKNGIVFTICDEKLVHYDYEEYYSTSGHPNRCKEIIIHDIVRSGDLKIIRKK